MSIDFDNAPFMSTFAQWDGRNEGEGGGGGRGASSVTYHEVRTVKLDFDHKGASQYVSELGFDDNDTGMPKVSGAEKVRKDGGEEGKAGDLLDLMDDMGFGDSDDDDEDDESDGDTHK